MCDCLVEIPREYQSPSDFMSPVTTPPNSAASVLPSGVKVRYRHEEDGTIPEGDRVGVRLQMDILSSNGASPAVGMSFKRPLDVILSSSDSLQQSSDRGDDDSEDRPSKISKKENPADQKSQGDNNEDVGPLGSENIENALDDDTPAHRACGSHVERAGGAFL